MIDRRSVCLGTAAAMVGASARAAPDTPFFTSGPMSRNRLAQSFNAPGTPLTLPDTPLIGAHGPQKLSQLSGRTYVVSLWGEWCAPCLEEMTDLAAISRTHDGPGFGVIFVLTSSFKKLDLAGARAVMTKRNAGDATLLAEPRGGKAIMTALASQDYDAQMRAVLKKDGDTGLPCNLLVDRHGRVRARSFGAPSEIAMPSGMVPGAVTVRTATAADKAKTLNDHTMWATPTGSEFAAALAAGVLDKA